MLHTIERQGFRIGTIALATTFRGARELARLPRLTRVPSVPDWVLGLGNLHGQPVPVFDIASLLGVEHDTRYPSMLLAFGEGDAFAGLVVDGPTVRLSVRDAVREPQVPWALARHVQSGFVAAEDEHTVWLEFDPARFVAELAEVIGIREGWTL